MTEPGSAEASHRPLAVAALVIVCAVWGTTFAVVKQAIEEIPPFEFLAIRFTIATLVLALAFPRKLLKAPRSFGPGIIVGLALAAGYGFQTTGLQFTSATNAGFVTGLFVVFAPLFSALLLRNYPKRYEWLAIAAAMAGLALLTLGPSFEMRSGDALVLGCAISFAIHIVLLGRYSPFHDPRVLTIVQLGAAALGFVLVTLAVERPILPRSGYVWFALFLTSVAASALAFLIQTWAQTRLDTTQTAVTLSMEPVFAGAAGFILLGERLSTRGLMGGLLIIGAMLLVAGEPRPLHRFD